MLPSFQRWVGNIAVITGANSGIGLEAAKRLTEEGVIVVGFDKNIENIQTLSKQLAVSKAELHPVKVDVTSESDVIHALKTVTRDIGPLSILINSAGVYIPTSILEGTTESWKTTLDVNLVALCVLCREAVKIMSENNIAGHIVNLSSIMAHKILVDLGIYTASKFAVKAVTETIRLEIVAKKLKIKVGCIAPGVVDTPLLRNNINSVEKLMSGYDYLKTSDIADAILYVLSTPPVVQIEELIIRPQGEPF